MAKWCQAYCVVGATTCWTMEHCDGHEILKNGVHLKIGITHLAL